MILEEAINNALRDTINAMTGIDGFAIRGQQLDAPRPTGNYAAVTFLTDTDVGWEEHALSDNLNDPDLTESATGFRVISYTIAVFRVNAFDICRRIRSQFVLEQFMFPLRIAGLGLMERSAVRQLSEALEGGWEERAEFDIDFSAVGTTAGLIRSLQSIEINAAYEDGKNRYPWRITI